MSCLSWVIIGFITYIAFKIRKFLKVPAIPKFENTWWGLGTPGDEDKSIKPFRINVSEELLDDLRKRLNNHRKFTPPLEGVHQHYGLNTNLLEKIITFWKENYNWRERENFLNKYPQFTVSVQGLNIHYIHVKPTPAPGVRVLPLALFHGWPGSVVEFYKIIPYLTTPQEGNDFVFEVVAPSLPGFGFSDGAVRPGLGALEMAVLFNNFLERVGFDKYYVQGGDWGSAIVTHLATFFPDRVLGVHSNMLMVGGGLATVKFLAGSIVPSLVFEEDEAKNKSYPLKSLFVNTLLESGYFHLQATKPDTVGVSLNDSPAGLAAYILEKFITWTKAEWKDRDDGGLHEKFSYTELLDNVMVYWVSNSITTSMRIYAETMNRRQKSGLQKIPITVPSACTRLLNDFDYFYTPKSILTLRFKNLMQVTDRKIGHFAAFEAPEELSKDIYSAVKKFENFHKYN